MWRRRATGKPLAHTHTRTFTVAQTKEADARAKRNKSALHVASLGKRGEEDWGGRGRAEETCEHLVCGAASPLSAPF